MLSLGGESLPRTVAMPRMSLLAAVLLGGPALAEVRQFDAGPIRDSWDAQDKCPEVCSREDQVWTGVWRMPPGARAATCDCRDSTRRN